MSATTSGDTNRHTRNEDAPFMSAVYVRILAAANSKVTGGFRSDWGADFYAAVRSIISTASRRGIDAYQAIKMVLQGQSVLAAAAE